MIEELSFIEMSEIMGGISKEEYCSIVNDLIEGSWKKWSRREKDAAMNAWRAHCMS